MGGLMEEDGAELMCFLFFSFYGFPIVLSGSYCL
jgi:hypothetical protein